VDDKHRGGGTIWILEDVTHSLQTQMEVEAIMTNASMSILFTKNRVITRYNRGFAEMFRYTGDPAWACPARAVSIAGAYDRWAPKPIPSSRSASRSRPRSRCAAPTTAPCGRS
jgi:hypothetical protein